MKVRAALFCGLLVGCAGGSHVLWQGKSPDRRHALEILDDSAEQWVMIDGHRTRAYGAISAPTLIFSRDGQHLAFAARQDGTWHVVRDHCLGPGFDGVSELVFSPDGERLAYAAERGGSWHVVVDADIDPAMVALLAGSLRFSQDGRHVAYAAQDQRGVHVVVDGRLGPPFEGVGQVALSADGTHVAYAARRAGAAYAVMDGEVGPRYDELGELVVGENGWFAYLGRRGRSWYAVLSGVEGPAGERLRGLVATRDGRHVAWVARAEGGEAVYLDGARASRRFHHIGALVLSELGEHWAFAAQDGAASRVVVDGVETPAETWVSDPVLTRNGARVGYLARRGPRVAVIVDGEAHVFDLVIGDSLVFSHDGTRWACVAGDREQRRLFFVADGRPTRALKVEELGYAAARVSLDELLRGANDRLLGDWSAAELALLTETGPRARPAWWSGRCRY